MTGLIFPESAADLSDAFDNAIAAGAMQREDTTMATYWARFEYMAYDAEAGEDIFYNSLSGIYVRVPRKEESE